MVKMKRPRSAASDAASNQPRSPPVRPTSSSSTSTTTTRINFADKDAIRSPLFSRFKSTQRSDSPSLKSPSSSPSNENQALPTTSREQLPHDNTHSFKKTSAPPTSRAKSFVHGLQTFVGGLAMAGNVKPFNHHGDSGSHGIAGISGDEGSRSGSPDAGKTVSPPSNEQCKCQHGDQPDPQSSYFNAQASDVKPSVSSSKLSCSHCTLNHLSNASSAPTFIQNEFGFSAAAPREPRRVKIDSVGDDPTVGLDVSPGWHVSTEGGFTGAHPPMKDDEDWSPAQSFPGGRLPPSLVARFSTRGKRGNSGGSSSTSSSSSSGQSRTVPQKYDGEKEALKKLHEAKMRDQLEREEQERNFGGKGKGKEGLPSMDTPVCSILAPTTSPSIASSSPSNNAASSPADRSSGIRSSTESADSRVSEFGIGFHRLGVASGNSSRSATPDHHNQSRLSRQEKPKALSSSCQALSESKTKSPAAIKSDDRILEPSSSSNASPSGLVSSPSNESTDENSVSSSAPISALKPIPIKIDTKLSQSAFDVRASSRTHILPLDTSTLKLPVPLGTSRALASGRRPFYRLTDFEALDTLGTGTFGRVLLVKHKLEDKSSANAYYAMKVLNKAQVVRLRQVEHINNERSILSKGPLPFTVSLYSTFQDSQNCYMLMEYVQGGEIFSHLRKARRFPVDVTRFYISQLVLSISDLHSRDIIYRDLKPENLLLDSKGYLKITDFGFSKHIPDGRTWTLCGTPEYLAPEIIQSKGHGKPVDWWALGVLAYEMLAGYPPFFDDNPFAVYEKILLGKLSFPPHIDAVSRDLIRQLLTTDRTRRLGNLSGGSEDVKNHYWFHGVQWDQLSAGKIRAPIIPRIRSPDDTCNYADYQDADPESMPGMLALDTTKSISDDPYSHLFPGF